MVKQDLIDRSPVRFFEKSLNGGVKPGEIGVIASKKGLGKTSVLVQIGLDMLLQGKQVVHVSFNQHSDYIITWYEDIFGEMAKKKNLNKSADVKDELFRKRVVLNFNQDTVSTQQITRTIKALTEGGIAADTLIIDGFDFNKATEDDFLLMHNFAREMQMVIWYSCNTEILSDKTPTSIAPMIKELDIVIILDPKPDSIHLKVLKNRNSESKDLDLRLDTKTLLIAEK